LSLRTPKGPGSDTLQAHGFRFCFTPLTAVLFTFPSRYWFTIGRRLVFSLTEWSPRIHTAFHVCCVTQELPRALANFSHGGFTLSAGAFHLLDLSLRVPRRGPTTPGASPRFGLLRFRSPLLTQSISLSFPPVTEMFHFTGSRVLFPTFPMLTTGVAQVTEMTGASGKDDGALPPSGYPIRKSPDQSACAAPRSLSQLVTSFIACRHQGIHCVPFKA